MVKEKYVDFETAKLLKEKGFNEYCYQVWALDRIGCKHEFAVPVFIEGNFMANNDNVESGRKYLCKEYNGLYPEAYARPTHLDAMMWLEEKFGIFITVRRGLGGSRYVYTPEIYDGKSNFQNIHTGYDSCVNAWDAAIKHCLKYMV